MQNTNENRVSLRRVRLSLWKRGVLGLLGLLAGVSCGAGFGVVQAGPAAPGRTCEVVWSVVGPDVQPADTAGGQGFAESLASRPGFAVTGVKTSGGVWGTPGKAGTEPVSVVNVAVGKHRDLLLFVMDDKGTTVLAGLRRECLMGRKTRRDWAGPGPLQIPENAVRELVQDFGHLVISGLKVQEDRQVSINVAAWKAAAAELAGGFTETPAPGGKGAGATQMAPGNGLAIQAVNALAIAAMSQAGAQPTTQAAAASLTIEVAQDVDHYALRYTLKRDGKSEQYVQRFIGQAELYDHIAMAARKLWAWRDGVRSAAKLGDGVAEPLSAGKGLTVMSVGGTIRGIDPVSGRDMWAAVPPRRVVFPQAVLAQATENKVLRMGKPSEMVDVQTGRLTAISTDAPVLPWAIDLGSGSKVAMVLDGTVNLSDAGKEVWKVTYPDPLTAGPGISEKAVFAGNEAGEVVALSSADGKEIWRQPTGLRLTGPVTLVGESVVVASFEGTVVALNAGDGKERWRYGARDVLLARPVVVDGLLLLADKGNTVCLLDPKTGEAKATFTAPTWLINAAAVEHGGKKWVVCSDLAGKVRFLDVPGLKPVSEVALDAQLSKPILQAADLPTIWGSGNEIDVKAAGVLVGDRRGWVYVLNFPR